MPRPRTTSIGHEMHMFRLPTTVMDEVRRYAALGDRPMNSEIIRLLQEALALRQEYGDVQERMLVAGTQRPRTRPIR